MKSKNLLLLLIPLLLVIGYFTYKNFVPQNPSVVVSDSIIKITTATPTTAFELLKSTSLPITYKHYSFGTLVESINGLQNTPDLSWIFFVNGKSADVGADQYQLKAGDVVEWKYVKPQF